MSELDISDVLRELRELRERLDEFPTCPAKPEGSLPVVKIEKDPAKPQDKLKPTEFKTYSGDRATYPAWRQSILMTLKMDWNTFGYDNSRVFLMIYNALEGKALRESSTFFESGGRDNRQDPADFIAFLDRSNWDTSRINRARDELNNLKMGHNQRWSSFFPLWANKLTEAHGDHWPDDTKISLLRGTLNYTLRAALANNHLLPPDDYFEWLRIVGQIAQHYDELVKVSSDPKYPGKIKRDAYKSDPESNLDTQKSRSYDINVGKSGTERGMIGDVDSSGDAFMGGVNAAKVLRGPNGKPLRAKWKSPQQIAKLKSERRCFRCERTNCSTKVCRLLPARKPEARGPVINLGHFSELDPKLYEEDVVDVDEVEEFSENL